jgi:regulator of replication initiation timing
MSAGDMTFSAFATQELSEVAARLAAAAAVEIETSAVEAAAPLRTEIEALRAELEALHAEQADAVTREEQLQADGDQLRRRIADLEATTARRSSELSSLQAHAGELEDEISKLHAEAATLCSEHDRLRGEHEAIRAEHAQMLAAQGELTDARVAAEQSLQQSRNLLDAARADALRFTDELEARTAENAVLTEQLESALGVHRSALIDRLQDVFERVVRSTSVEDVLATVAEGLAEDFSRVAVFTVNDNRLEPTHQYGFDAHSGIEKVLVPLNADSLFSQAANADVVQAIAPAAVAKSGGPSFGGAPNRIVTAPVKVRGEVLAVIYADDSGLDAIDEAVDDRVKLADLLRQTAVLRLDRLTIELKTIFELRAYAKMLLDEVEYVYSADASAAKPDGERQARLQENLRCARQIYQQRVTVEGPAVAALLDEHIAETITSKASQPYGRDLARALAASQAPAERSTGRRASGARA